MGEDFHMTLFASIVREILKNNTSSENIKTEKVIVKDMIKALSYICQSTVWINPTWVRLIFYPSYIKIYYVCST